MNCIYRGICFKSAAEFVREYKFAMTASGMPVMEGVGDVQNYKRKISYFYQYHNGMVGSTAGFLKMEIRGETVKIIINIQDPSGIQDREASLYLYHEAGDRLIAVRVDEVPNLEGVLTFQKKTDWMNVFGSGRDLYTFDGVAVVYHASHYFIGDFQDRSRKNYELVLQEMEKPKKQETVPVREAAEAERVREISGRYRNPRAAAPVQDGQTGGKARDAQAATAEAVQQEDGNKRAGEEAGGKPEDRKEGAGEEAGGKPEDRKEEAGEKAGGEPEDRKEGAGEKAGGEPEEKACEMNDGSSAAKAESGKGDGFKKNPEKTSFGETDAAAKNVSPEEAPQPQKGSRGTCEQCPYYQRRRAGKGDADAFEAMLREYPRLPMYNASELFDCVRIVPRDIGRLDMRNWKLGVNSFLTHGYYSYHYLLLGRMRFDDGTSRSIIGVPGVFSNREKYLANMFGFDQFIPVKKTGIKTGEFGYWIVEISPYL